jgi:hypothetical protein
MNFSRTSSFKARVEEAVAQTLDSRFLDTIPKTVPDCCIDLLPKGAERNMNTAIFPRTSQIESLGTDEKSTAEFLASAKVKTVGLLDHLSISKIFIKKTQDELKNDILAHTKSCADSLTSENAITDGFIFKGADDRYFGYTDTLLPHSKSQISARFSSFLKSGGAIVSIQGRILPMTLLAICSEETSKPILANRSVLFCEITDHASHIWIAADCGDKIISPLAAESRVGNISAASYAIESLCAQTEKQYRMWNPTLAVLIDGIENPEIHSEIHNLLSETCSGNVVEMKKDISQNASLYGAALLAGEKI